MVLVLWLPDPPIGHVGPPGTGRTVPGLSSAATSLTAGFAFAGRRPGWIGVAPTSNNKNPGSGTAGVGVTRFAYCQ